MHKCRFGVNTNLELVDKFCYLGDMLRVDGDADAAMENRIRIGWNKFRQLVSLLTNRDMSLTVRGKLYSSWVHSSMLHGSENWPVRKKNELQDRIPSKGVSERLEWDDIILVLQQYRLEWYRHVLRKEDNDWVKKCMVYEVKGARPSGRPKKTYREIVEKTVRHVN